MHLTAAPVALVISFASIYGSVQFGTTVYKSSLASQTWSSVPGEVQSSVIEKGCGKGGGGYFLQITYAYLLDGKKYVGDRISFTRHFCNRSYTAAEDFAAQYKQGALVNVYYDPANPFDSVLRRGRRKDAVDFIFFPLFLAPLSLAALLAFGVYGRNSRKRVIDSSKAFRSRQMALAKGIDAEVAERLREKAKKAEQSRDA